MKKSEAYVTLQKYEEAYKDYGMSLDDHPLAKAYIIANMDRLNAAIAALPEDENGQIDAEAYETLMAKAEVEEDMADMGCELDKKTY